MKQKEGSLLVRLHGMGRTILVIKDFTSILETRAEAKAEILSQIREIMDGSFRKEYGTGKSVVWDGKLAFICGVTPVLDKHYSVHSMLGERFLNFRMEAGDNEKMSERAISTACRGKENVMRKELEKMTADFLNQFKEPKIETIEVEDQIREKMKSLVELISRGRTGVSRDRYTRTIDYLPQPEGTPRLMKQVWILGAGIAVIQQKSNIDDEIYEILKKVGRDSLPKHRDLILSSMWKGKLYGEKWDTTRALARLINFPTPTARIYFEDLLMVGILNRRIEGEEIEGDDTWKSNESKPYFWQLSERCVDLIQRSQIHGPVNGIEFEDDYDEHYDFKEPKPLYTIS
jgi:hypothetical protein